MQPSSDKSQFKKSDHSSEHQKNVSEKKSDRNGPDEHSAGFIIFRLNKKQQNKNQQREYLILHYPGGHFDFPKGHLENEETTKQAALRELEEETGIKNEDIEIVEDFKMDIQYFFKRAGKLIKKTVTFFLAKSHEFDVRISHEHQGAYWFPYEEGMQKVTFDNARQVLSASEKKLNEIFN